MNEPIVIDIYNNPLHGEIFKGAHRLCLKLFVEPRDELLQRLYNCASSGVLPSEDLKRQVEKILDTKP